MKACYTIQKLHSASAQSEINKSLSAPQLHLEIEAL